MLTSIISAAEDGLPWRCYYNIGGKKFFNVFYSERPDVICCASADGRRKTQHLMMTLWVSKHVVRFYIYINIHFKCWCVRRSFCILPIQGRLWSIKSCHARDDDVEDLFRVRYKEHLQYNTVAMPSVVTISSCNIVQWKAPFEAPCTAARELGLALLCAEIKHADYIHYLFVIGGEGHKFSVCGLEKR
jgi:hypothetical protein